MTTTNIKDVPFADFRELIRELQEEWYADGHYEQADAFILWREACIEELGKKRALLEAERNVGKSERFYDRGIDPDHIAPRPAGLGEAGWAELICKLIHTGFLPRENEQAKKQLDLNYSRWRQDCSHCAKKDAWFLLQDGLLHCRNCGMPSQEGK